MRVVAIASAIAPSHALFRAAAWANNCSWLCRPRPWLELIVPRLTDFSRLDSNTFLLSGAVTTTLMLCNVDKYGKPSWEAKLVARAIG